MKDSREIAFLDWFANQTPKRPAPFPGVGGNVPGLPNDLSERPDISLPKGLGLENIGTGAPSEPPPSFPAPSSTVPASQFEVTPPDTTKSSDTKPAETPPPAAPNAGGKKSD